VEGKIDDLRDFLIYDTVLKKYSMTEIARLHIHSDIIYDPKRERYVKQQLSKPGVSLIPRPEFFQSRGAPASEKNKRSMLINASTLAFSMSRIGSLAHPYF